LAVMVVRLSSGVVRSYSTVETIHQKQYMPSCLRTGTCTLCHSEKGSVTSRGNRQNV
jgi:hypothetical protein